MPDLSYTYKGIFLSRWSNKELFIPNWAIHAVIWLVIVRTFSYGIELLLIVTNNPIGPLMAFANVFGIQLWGILMLGALLVFLLGMLTRSTLLLTLGALLCAAVWVSFACSLGVGAFALGTGWRFAIAAAATAGSWIVFFLTQLTTIKRRGLTHV